MLNQPSSHSDKANDIIKKAKENIDKSGIKKSPHFEKAKAAAKVVGGGIAAAALGAIMIGNKADVKSLHMPSSQTNVNPDKITQVDNNKNYVDKQANSVDRKIIEAAPKPENIIAAPQATTEKTPQIVKVTFGEFNSSDPGYIASKEKIDSFAKESGLTSKLADYNKALAAELLNKMTATLEQKGATLTPQEKSILQAKIDTWRHIEVLTSSDSLDIRIAKISLDTIRTAVGTDPDSVLLKTKVDTVTGVGILNAIDIANNNYAGSGTFGGQNPGQAGNLTHINNLRSK